MAASVGWVSSMGSIAFAGNQIDGVDFRWTTSAGGEGTVPISDGGNDSSGVKGGGNNLLNSPTGGGIRNDSGGLGHYGALRGSRLHGGIDFSSTDGQNIISPIDGKVRNFIGNSSRKPMLEVIPNNSNLGFDKIQMLYVDPPQGLNYSFSFRNISSGDIIGRSVNLQSLGYRANVGPHIHLQMFLKGVRINPTPFFFKR